MEDLTKELHPHASTEPAQVSQPAHYRFYHTRLWSLIRGEIEITIHKRSCIDCPGAEKDNQCRHNPPAAKGSMLVGASAMLDEFLSELQSYCREEKDLTERMRTLRFTRSGLITALFMRTPPGAEKKCGHHKACGTGARHFRLRIEDCRYGVGTPGTVCRRSRSRPQSQTIIAPYSETPQFGHNGYDGTSHGGATVRRHRQHYGQRSDDHRLCRHFRADFRFQLQRHLRPADRTVQTPAL